MGKKAKLKQMKKNGQTYNLLHVPKGLYATIFPESDSGDYYAYDLSNELTRVKEEEKKKNTYIASIRHVVIGTHYLTWLEEEKLENTYENRLLYAENLTDETVATLWEEFKKENKKRFIPFVAVSDTDAFADDSVISRERAEEAKGILAQAFQVKKELISIHPKFLRHQETYKSDASVIKEEKGLCAIRFLAVSLPETRTAIQSRKEFEQGRWTERKVPQVSLTTWAEEAWDGLPQGAEIISVPGLLAPTQTKDFANAFQANLQKMHV